IAKAEEWLRELGDPTHVSFSPGNHDAYTPGAMPALSQTFTPWTTGDDGANGFPYLRRRGGVALIGLTSGVPTAPFVASGRLGPAQLDRLAALLEQAEAEGLARVVLLHHPPHRGGARPLRALDDAAHFEGVIARHGAELVVHGHNHQQSVHHLAAPKGRTPVVGVASASARPEMHRPGAGYHLYEISREDSGVKVRARARGFDLESGRIIDHPALEL
ncbi:MAG TPA: metallophosphoesterase, partial [Methylocystis sp.]|nr:metallophosphoesterase [Methylocystis sp.]